MHHLEVNGLTATYDGKLLVLDDVNIQVDKGQIVSVIGPSGSGKSTLLRVIMGLLPPKSGEVKLDGNTVDYGNKKNVKALRDRFAIVFQQFNLFQNMDALRNVTIAPVKIRKRDARQAEEEAIELLGKVGLGDKLRAYPDELSGGQQQRVAIARALALKPEILLLDEVTSALDPELVNEVLDAIRILASDGMTMMIVSHEMGFVREISTEVIMMDEGKVIEVGSAARIFDNPQTTRCQDFVGKILRHCWSVSGPERRSSRAGAEDVFQELPVLHDDGDLGAWSCRRPRSSRGSPSMDNRSATLSQSRRRCRSGALACRSPSRPLDS